MPPELERRYVEEGLWSDRPLGALLDGYLREAAGETFAVWSATRPHRSTLGEVGEAARRVAGGLRERGVGAGDVVAFQLPNWVEAAAVFWGVSFAGAVLVPIVHFYGAREVGHILRQSGARALVTADRFGRVDHLAQLQELLPDLPRLEHVFVVGPGGSGDAGARGGRADLARGGIPGVEPFDTLTAGPAIEHPTDVDPAGPALVAYTSGTTAEPKGVVHTHRSVTAETVQLGDLRGSGDRPMLVGAPVGHAIGMLSGLLVPLYRGHPVHLLDVWEPGEVLRIMEAEELNGGSGATFFLQSLLDHPDCGPAHLRLMERVGLGGAPVPAAVTDRAAALGISVVRSYGCTEHPSVTGSHHDEPAPKRMYTDGHPLPGVELRIVDERGDDLPAGEAGEIWSRGPDLCGGYTDPELTGRAFTADGWFRTGDVGVLDGDGYLSVTDRLSDVIIRGGENVSATEVEELMARMPGVAEVAVVAAPDARLGEHACAFVRVAPGCEGPPELDEMRRHLEASGLARQKWPEEIRAIDDFPRTASGKIMKVELRARLREEARSS